MSMVKRVIAMLLAGLLLLSAAPLSGLAELDWPDFSALFAVKAKAATHGVLEYKIFGGAVIITDCDSSISGALEIPAVIEGYPVTGIHYWAFAACTGLTSVTIPNSVTSIGNWAFSGCTGLESITIPDSVTSIHYCAFSGCTGLTEITIPDSVTSIGDSAFYHCTGLMSITIPDSVTSIGDRAFEGCTGLTSITIPDSVTRIGNCAFHDCTGLTSITIPDSVTSIGYYAFYDCTGLTSITIPDSVTSIGVDAFRGCSNLRSIYYAGSESDWAAAFPDTLPEGTTVVYNSSGPSDPDHPGTEDGNSTITGILEQTVLTIIMNGDETYISSLIIDGNTYGVNKTYSLTKTPEMFERFIGKKVTVLLDKDRSVIRLQEATGESEQGETPVDVQASNITYGIAQYQTRKSQAESALSEFYGALEDYFSALRAGLKKEVGDTSNIVDARTFAKQLQTADQKSSDPYISNLMAADLSGAPVPNSVVDAAYYALASLMKNDLDATLSLSSTNFNKSLIEIDASVVNQVQAWLRNSGTHSYKYGSYSIEIQMTSLGSAFTGNMTITKINSPGKGTQYRAIVKSTTAETEQVIVDYMNCMKDFYNDLFKYSLYSIYSDFANVIGLTSLTEGELTKYLTDKVGALQKYGFGSKALTTIVGIRSGYICYNSLISYFKTAKSLGNGNLGNNPGDILNKQKDLYEKIVGLDFSTSGVRQTAVKEAIKQLKKAQKKVEAYLYNYLYNTDEKSFDERSFWQKLGFNCPVEFELYDANGNLVGYVDSSGKHDEYVWSIEEIEIDVNGDVKHVYLPEDLSVTVKMIATDDGMMDYSIEHFEGNQPLDRLNYYDVPLVRGEVYTQILPADYSLSDVKSTLALTGKSAIYPDEYIQAKDSSFVTVLCETDENGAVLGGGEYPLGESVTVYAMPLEGYRFVGWYESGYVVSGEPCYQFVAKANTILTAKFEKAAETSQDTENAELLKILVASEKTAFLPGESAEIMVACVPYLVQETVLSWTSANPEIATVSNEGVVTAKSSGQTIITVKDSNTGKAASLLITVRKLNYQLKYFVDGTVLSEAELKFGDPIVKPEPPIKEGYVFTGWTPEVPDTMPAEDLTFYAVFVKNEEPPTQQPMVAIHNYFATRSEAYKTTLTFTADATNAPEGAAVHWFVNDKDVGVGEQYTVKQATADYTVQCKLIKDGQVLAESEVETVKIKTGFFAKLIAFFRNLFGRLPVVEQAFKEH